ncbi:MAG: VanZ family protein [Muribaculaceae bacterium]|nr:VanZ family protein [Muribaculaceae bacterium]
MVFDFDSFLIELIRDVPIYVYEMLISVACVCIVILFAIYNRKKAILLSFKLLFWEYLFLTYSNTILFRPKNSYVWHDFNPFWSYKAYYSGENPNLLPEIIMNIVGFIPLGFLMNAAFQKMRWWQVILVGFFVSLSIESIQYFCKLGISEFDDVFNNTLGVAIGVAFFLSNGLSTK